MSPTISLLAGESLLSLYPIVVKTTTVSLPSQTLIRIVTFAVVSYLFMSLTVWEVITTPVFYLIATLNILHIYASYVGFQILDVGVALSIFYLYPIINVLIKNGVEGRLDWRVIGVFVQSLLGVYLIGSVPSVPNPAPTIAVAGANPEPQQLSRLRGIIMILAAAIMESLIYTLYKQGHQTNPFNMLFILSFIGPILLVIMGLGLATSPSPPPLQGKQNLSITLFQSLTSRPIMSLIVINLIIGVIGHLLRFYSISHVSTEWFSILAFCEVIMGYLLGWLLLKEPITKWHWLGTALIAHSVYRVQQMGFH